MPRFSTEPPPEQDHSGYRLIRTPAAHALLAQIISDNLVGCNTHFTNNRTVPCEQPTCDACQNGIAWRWHGYLLVLTAANQEIVIFECTARASAAFRAHRQTYKTLRGARFKAVRLNQRANGRVLITVKPGDLTRITLPPDQPVEKLLCHIWNIPPATVEKQDHKPRMPFDHATVDRLKDEGVIPLTSPATVSEAVRVAMERRKANGRGSATDHRPT